MPPSLDPGKITARLRVAARHAQKRNKVLCGFVSRGDGSIESNGIIRRYCEHNARRLVESASDDSRMYLVEVGQAHLYTRRQLAS